MGTASLVDLMGLSDTAHLLRSWTSVEDEYISDRLRDNEGKHASNTHCKLYSSATAGTAFRRREPQIIVLPVCLHCT